MTSPRQEVLRLLGEDASIPLTHRRQPASVDEPSASSERHGRGQLKAWCPNRGVLRSWVPVLLDRRREFEELDRLLDAARAGLSATVVLRGEPGIGKTALLNRLLESAPEFRVARVDAVESEMELDFAGLHQVLSPFLPRLDRLPVPQRHALGAAFGLVVGGPPDRFLVGLATLTLLADAAAERPLLVVVDDAQWLDRESAAVLAFVARRLLADGIAILFAVRDADEQREALEGLPELDLGGLQEEAARKLRRSVVQGRLDDLVCEQILGKARGNPLAVLEFAGELAPAQLTSQSLLPDPLPLGTRLEHHYLRQVRALPATSQRLLLLAAAEPSGDPALFWRAADRLALGPEAAVGETERLLAYVPQVAFRHPLIRSAIYAGAQAAERRRVHEALAAASDPARDPDRRAWHGAMAAIAPDEQVARELERSAGAIAAIAPCHAERLLAASQAELDAGAPARARVLLSEVAPRREDQSLHAQALRLQGMIDYTLGQLARTPSILLRAAERFDPFDADLARATHLEAMQAALYAGRLATGADALSVAHSTRAASLRETATGALLAGFSTLLVDGYTPAVPLFRRAIELLASDH